MPNEKIVMSRQYIWTLFILFASFAVIQVPGLMLGLSGRDCWLAILCAWTLDVVFGSTYAYLGYRFPNQNYIQHSVTLWGFWGKIPGLFLLALFLLFCMNNQYSLFLLVNKLVMPELAPEILLSLSLLLVGYIAHKGIKVIIHFCEAIGPIFFISLIILMLILTPLIKPESLKPQLTTGFFPFLGATFFTLTFLGICIMMTMFIPLSSDPQNGLLAKFAASTLGSFVVVVLTIFIGGIFGIFQAREMFYPGLELARIIQFGNFSGRVELIWIIITITVLMTSSACLLWAFCSGLSQYIGSQNPQPFIYPSAFLILMLSLTAFHSDVEFDQFLLYVYPQLPTTITFFEFLLVLTALITKKKT